MATSSETSSETSFEMSSDDLESDDLDDIDGIFEGVDAKEFVENHAEIRQTLKKMLPKDETFFTCRSCSNSVAQQCKGCMIGHFYCSSQCQRSDWKEHKANCGKRYKCEEIPKKGMGNVATRNISKGEIICVERSVLMIDTCNKTQNILIPDIKKVYNEKFRKLSSDQQEAIMNLTYQYKDKKNSPKDKEFATFLGIMKSNLIELQKFDVNQAGLFMECSRFNHSCMPNADTFFAEPYMRVFAIRDILKGEEICFTYYGDNLLAKRDISDDTPPTIQELKVPLKVAPFTCYCELCQMEDESKLEEINNYRIKFWKLEKKLYQTESGSLQYIKLCHEMLDHINCSETLHLVWTDFYSRKGFLAALLAKEKEEAKYFSEQYYKSIVIRQGEDSPRAAMTKTYQLLIDYDDLEDTDASPFFRELLKEMHHC